MKWGANGRNNWKMIKAFHIFFYFFLNLPLPPIMLKKKKKKEQVMRSADAIISLESKSSLPFSLWEVSELLTLLLN